jgi:hypothetical protein
MLEHNDDQHMSHHAEEHGSHSSEETSSESSEQSMRHMIEERISEEIRRDIEMRLHYYSEAGREEIDERLKQLDEEWDIERAFEVNAAGSALFGLTFGMLFGRKWFILPALSAGFLLQRSLKGWSPPMTLLRRIGFRTPAEIESERYALKALRGDFQGLQPAEEKEAKDLAKVLEAVEK